MRVSVVLSTYTKERSKDVVNCINSIKRQKLKPIEIILVLDPIEELVEFYKELIPEGVRIFASNSFGLSNARNKGVMESKGDIIAFIDDDAWADENWLENLVKNFEDENVWVVGGKIVPVFERKRPGWLAEELDWLVGCTYRGMPEKKTEIRNPIGANMAFKREVFEIAGLFRAEVGRYGEKLLGSEETELCMRLKKLKPNVKIIYEPSAIVYHRVSESRTRIGYALRRAFYEGYSKAILAGDYNLTVEKNYLQFILKSILGKVIRAKPLEAFGIMFVIFATALGTIRGHLQVSLLSKI